MPPPQPLIYLLSIMLVLNYSCKKIPEQKEKQHEIVSKNPQVPDNFFKKSQVPGVVDPDYNPNIIETEYDSADNGDDPLILGQQLNNPYTITNMQQAYWQLYGSSEPVAVTHLYVRFKPANVDQLRTLIDDQNLELQDYPMDYSIVQDGDFYQDPTISTEEIGWLYSVVAPDFSAPAGIQYEVLAQLHLPPNNNLLLESFAESLAAGGTYGYLIKGDYRYVYRTDIQNEDTLIVANRLPVPCETDPCLSGPGCPPPPPECGGGGGEPTYDPQKPRGTIEVQDIRTCNNPNTVTNVPVRQARIVCKRWFKIWRGYTDDLGRFQADKKFNNKVKILLKTENNHAKVAKIRGIRLWQILFPVKKRIGVFDQGAMANVSYLFEKPNPTSAHDKQLPYWVATTTHNSVIEYKQYAVEFGVNPPQVKLQIIVTNWGLLRNAGSTPMWNKCHLFTDEITMASPFIAYMASQPTYIVAPGGLASLLTILKDNIDMFIGYAAQNADYSCRLTSANLKAIVYHELGHASHFGVVSCDYWKTLRVRISNEICCGNPNTQPYGDGTEANAGIVAVSEMWGYHCEHVFTNRHYGDGGVSGPFPNGFTAYLQGQDWENAAGLNCYLNAIENHNPNISPFSDRHKWIPKGICYDLEDNRNDAAFGGSVIDNVNAYNIGLCFSALQDDVRDVQKFRDRLLQQNSNLQAPNVYDLFFSYNY